MRFIFNNKDDLSEHTRLLPSSLQEDKDKEVSVSRRLIVLGVVLVALTCCLYASSQSNNNNNNKNHTTEATMMQFMNDWDQWGQIMWGRSKQEKHEIDTADSIRTELPLDTPQTKQQTTTTHNNTKQQWDKWNTTTQELQTTQDWFQHAWNQTSQQAHAIWNQMPHNNNWWNQTMQNEQHWWNHTLLQLHHLGTTLQSWWTDHTQDKQQVLQQQFQQWYQHASQAERQWWNDTVHASKQFEQGAQHQMGLWWDATRAATGKQWDAAVHEERVWWNATEKWFHDHPADTLQLVYLNSSQAYAMLMNGYGWYDYYSSDFFLYPLDAQINQAYCAVASSAALLNSLRSLIELPIDPNYDPHPYATQTILLQQQSDCVHQNVIRYDDTFNGILQFPGGLSLQQTQQLLECHLDSNAWNVRIVHVDPSETTTTTNIDQIRHDLQSALHDPTSRVLINYDRKALGQDGGGHFSPLGSYSPQHDAFLILDVAKYKYPPVWVPTARLLAAMGTVDMCGMWKFPEQQNRLAEKDLLRPESAHAYEKARGILGCEERFRGYLIVKLKQ